MKIELKMKFSRINATMVIRTNRNFINFQNHFPFAFRLFFIC